MSARVKLADHAADRPQAGSLLAVGLVTLCAGFGVAQGIHQLATRSARGSQSESLAPEPPRAPAPNDRAPEAALEAHTTRSGIEAAEEAPARVAVAVAEAAPVAAAVPVPQAAVAVAETPPVVVAQAPAPIAAPAPEPPPAVVPARATDDAAARELTNIGESSAGRAPSFQMGIVAYDRCDGLSQRPGRFPCPRDLKLEQQVWQALRALETCKLAQTERGQAELRYEWIEGRAMPLRVRGLGRSAVSHAVVTKCTGRGLGAARESLGADHMIVRFRFELR